MPTDFTSPEAPPDRDVGGPLLEVVDLKTYFHTEQGLIRAVDGVSFAVREGEALGIVGESGCGKSITVRSVMRLIPQPPGEIAGGRILYYRDRGEVLDIATLSPRGRKIRSLRGNEIAMIFQEPMTSLSPIYTIGAQIMEAVILHQKVSQREARAQAIDMLRRVNIAAPEKRVDAYQHQISGGMRQRAMIALALSCNPKLLIADEPTTALDVTIEAQILVLIKEMQRTEGGVAHHDYPRSGGDRGNGRQGGGDVRGAGRRAGHDPRGPGVSKTSLHGGLTRIHSAHRPGAKGWSPLRARSPTPTRFPRPAASRLDAPGRWISAGSRSRPTISLARGGQ